MKRFPVWVLSILLLLVAVSCSRSLFQYRSTIPEDTERYWIGPEFWSNRLQDWQIRDGRIECIGGRQPLRTVHLLTHSLGPEVGNLRASVRTGLIGERETLSGNAFSGFLIGAGDAGLDYRANAIIHLGSGENGGLAVGLNGAGRIVFLDNEKEMVPLPIASRSGEAVVRHTGEDLELRLLLYPDAGRFGLTLSVYDAASGRLLQEATTIGIESSRLTGSIALVAHEGADPEGRSFWFRDLEVSGSKVEIHEEQQYGPVLGVLYTLDKGILKLTAQFPPLADTDPRTADLQIRSPGGTWETVARAELVTPGWTAPFKVTDWDSSRDVEYRIAYPGVSDTGSRQLSTYEGTIRHDPVDKDEIVIAAFTGNSNTLGSFSKRFSFTRSRLWFPHQEIYRLTDAKNPDLLVFTGDQVYEGRPTPPDRSGTFDSYLDYLYKWYLWCWAYHGLTREIPTVCLPDDHDVYHGNIWGAGGRKARGQPADGRYPDHYKGFEGHWRQDGGGYLMPPEFVNMVQRTQTSHLPDPVDPEPVEQGITVYFTDMTYGGISFAVLEDRKFKSAPSVVVPAAKVVNGFPQVRGFDMRRADVPGARLLGDRQLRFLDHWATDWEGAWMKVSLSQTIFATVSTYPKDFLTDAGTPRLKPLQPGEMPEGYELSRDMDTNGWPQTGRNKALRALRKGFAFMIAGDQHLGSIVHHGVDTWNDAGYSFCVPSIANLWPRRWYPPEPGLDRLPEMPPYTGKFKDAFGNHITVWAVSNPVVSNQEPAELYDRAPGFGLVRLNKKQQTITIECWPRWVDPSDDDAEQYEGWPLTIAVADNYDREAAAYLPEIEIRGIEFPILQVIKSRSGEIVYTRRLKESRFRPHVFEKGVYDIRVGEPGTRRMKTIEKLRAEPESKRSILIVSFD